MSEETSRALLPSGLVDGGALWLSGEPFTIRLPCCSRPVGCDALVAAQRDGEPFTDGGEVFVRVRCPSCGSLLAMRPVS